MFRFMEMLSPIDYTPFGLRLFLRGAADIEHFELPGGLLDGLDHVAIVDRPVGARPLGKPGAAGVQSAARTCAKAPSS